MSESDTYTAYKHMLMCAVKYRHMNITQPELTETEFMTAVNRAGYVTFTSVRDGHKYLPPMTTIWVVIGDAAAAAKESKAFQVMWAAIDPPDGSNVVLVTSNALRSNIQSVIESKRSKTPGIYIECVTKSVFAFEIPTHVANNPHSIVEKSELDMYTDRLCTDPNFKQILSTDPQVVWIGARPGNVIKIDCISFSSCKSIDYRIVV